MFLLGELFPQKMPIMVNLRLYAGLPSEGQGRQTSAPVLATICGNESGSRRVRGGVTPWPRRGQPWGGRGPSPGGWRGSPGYAASPGSPAGAAARPPANRRAGPRHVASGRVTSILVRVSTARVAGRRRVGPPGLPVKGGAAAKLARGGVERA